MYVYIDQFGVKAQNVKHKQVLMCKGKEEMRAR